MKRSACRRIFRNCHHFRKMRYQETTEKTTRIASTNFVSRLEVSTSSQGVVGTARPTCSSSTGSALPQRSRRTSQFGYPDGCVRCHSQAPARIASSCERRGRHASSCSARPGAATRVGGPPERSEEHTSELQSPY